MGTWLRRFFMGAQTWAVNEKVTSYAQDRMEVGPPPERDPVWSGQGAAHRLAAARN